MSNIPEARRLLEDALEHTNYDAFQLRLCMRQALELMTRKSPEFVVRRSLPPLSETDKEYARIKRKQGFSLNEIAQALGTNIGRVSEAINT